jgi:glycosyltransferase involved in cell wall biosynthesis
LAAIEELKCEIDFDFILVENLARADALRLVQHCDIFVDQLILGSYGLASCEAMAYGKPVLCYIMPSVFENGLTKSCPIVNVTIETIKDKLRELLLDESMRLEIGNQSRMFAVSNFNANLTAAHFINFYRKVLDMRTRK